jgi:hypothetical protein
MSDGNRGSGLALAGRPGAGKYGTWWVQNGAGVEAAAEDMEARWAGESAGRVFVPDRRSGIGKPAYFAG